MSVESQLAQEQSNPDAVRGRVQEIADDYAKLAASCSAEINRKRRAVREKCQERLWVAAIWRDYHLEMAQKSYEAELKQIDKEHQLEFAALTDLLMQELQEERKRLQALESMEAQNGSQTLTIDKQGNLEEGGVGGLPAAVDDDAGLAAELAADSSSAGGRRLRRRELAALQASSLGADMSAFPGSQSQAGSAGAAVAAGELGGVLRSAVDAEVFGARVAVVGHVGVVDLELEAVLGRQLRDRLPGSRLVERLEAHVNATATVGVGHPGAISPATGLIKNANSTWLNGKPLDKDLSKRLSRSVCLTNDANCFALSEAVDPLCLAQRVDAGALDVGDVDEHVLRAVIRLNETKTLGRVEPLHCSSCHISSPPLPTHERAREAHNRNTLIHSL